VYSLATVAFVGGSLVPAGGHNPLEPAQFGAPIVMGPHYENFREIVEKLRKHEAIQIIEPAGLSATLLEMLRSETLSKAMGERAKEVFHAESGATARAVEALLALLPGASA
jgi:3-deoxy-D-manno-octulosonic-acid transferase